ncbi:hypothetical protein FACS1894132_11140 [Clostridia bacterium]|nr:hypothetical protein FACS1894132_11140 [Clostridia bacterium]
MYINQNSNTLTHHGILGMKWGVRRFQNKDGSLTNAGKKRYIGKDIKYLQKQYGKVEDALTYGKHSNKKINSKIEKQLEDIEKLIDSKERELIAIGNKHVKENYFKK